MSAATRQDAFVVEVPDIGDFADVPIIEILVSPGDSVSQDDPLLTLESDKATMDVPAPVPGTVKELLVQIGDTVSQGTRLLAIDANGGQPATGAETPEAATPVTPAPPEPVTPAPAEPVTPAPAEPVTTAPAEPVTTALPATTPQRPDTSPARDAPPTAENGRGPIYASPSARRLARELGVSLRSVSGSGRKGRITKEDVQRLADGKGAVSAPPPPDAAAGVGTGLAGLDLLPWPNLDFEKYGPVERVPRSRIQRIAAPNLARNWVMIPHVTQYDEADITELEAWRKRLNSEQARDEVKVTVVAFLVAACVAALKEFPDFNSSLDGDELVRKRYYNIGFAADTPGGLVVPVIKAADEKGLLDIARELADLSGKARAGKLMPGDMSGATFTISSLGGIGGTSFTPIINAPEVAILGVSRAAMRPVWDGHEFVPRLMVPLSLSYDHRVIDGAAAARFVVHLGQTLSDLRRALL
ncbi:MAG TPA: dihydrolipoyllysine-residue acetyltransferase [Solirubrobacteraceae bacterium]